MALKFELRTLVCSSSLRSVCLQLSPVALVTSAFGKAVMQFLQTAVGR